MFYLQSNSAFCFPRWLETHKRTHIELFLFVFYNPGGNVSTRISQELAPAGHYAFNGVLYVCPAGYFGGTVGLTTATCSGPCSVPGYYCPGTNYCCCCLLDFLLRCRKRGVLFIAYNNDDKVLSIFIDFLLILSCLSSPFSVTIINHHPHFLSSREHFSCDALLRWRRCVLPALHCGPHPGAPRLLHGRLPVRGVSPGAVAQPDHPPAQRGSHR